MHPLLQHFSFTEHTASIYLELEEINMFGFGKCKHPFDRLSVLKNATQEPSADYPTDFMHITHHYRCGECDEILTKTYSSCIGGVDAFLGRPSADEQATADRVEAHIEAARKRLNLPTPYESAADQRDPSEYLQVPTAFNGHDGHTVWVGPKGEIEFRTPNGKLDFQTIEAVTVRMTKQDVQNSPELMELMSDVIRFAIKRKNGEI